MTIIDVFLCIQKAIVWLKSFTALIPRLLPELCSLICFFISINKFVNNIEEWQSFVCSNTELLAVHHLLSFWNTIISLTKAVFLSEHVLFCFTSTFLPYCQYFLLFGTLKVMRCIVYIIVQVTKGNVIHYFLCQQSLVTVLLLWTL